MKDKEELQLTIGNRIKKLRESVNMPQQNLAAKCNMEKSNLSRLESGGTNPTIYTLYKIADCLDISISELVQMD